MRATPTSSILPPKNPIELPPDPMPKLPELPPDPMPKMPKIPKIPLPTPKWPR